MGVSIALDPNRIIQTKAEHKKMRSISQHVTMFSEYFNAGIGMAYLTVTLPF